MKAELRLHVVVVVEGIVLANAVERRTESGENGPHGGDTFSPKLYRRT
jgi:hypothetical protein